MNHKDLDGVLEGAEKGPQQAGTCPTPAGSYIRLLCGPSRGKGTALMCTFRGTPPPTLFCASSQGHY